MAPRRSGSNTDELTVADLFCGAGGITEGFSAAGYRVKYAIDNDKEAMATFRSNHPSVEAEVEDLALIKRKDLADRIHGVDVVVGGPCCQGFSTSGRRKADDWRNGLWRHMHAAVKLAKPSAFMLENVPGLAQAEDGTFRGAIVDAFVALGYKVRSQILLAANYGVPQLRRRVFVIGVHKRFEFEFPESPYLGGWRRDTLGLWETRRQEQGKHCQLTVADAIDDLPLLRAGRRGAALQRYSRRPRSDYARLMRVGSGAVTDHEAAILSDEHRELVSYVPPGGTWRDIPPHLLPERFRGGIRRTDSTNLFGRLDPRRPAYTITTQFGNVTCGCFTHPTEDRPLSIREAARLQSFPDRYEFVGSPTSRRRQIGNAVPPILAQHLACALAESLGRPASKPKVVLSRFKGSRSVPAPTKGRRVLGAEFQEALTAKGVAFDTDVSCDFGYRRNVDVLVSGVSLAVFIDECFLHGCPDHSRPTKAKTKWWRRRIEDNKMMDANMDVALLGRGFSVLRIWEHEGPEDAAERVSNQVKKMARKRVV